MFRPLFGRKKKPPASTSLGDSIKDAVVGDVFTITDLSIEYEDSYFIIEKLNRYTSAGGQWHELLGVDGDDRLWIYWSDQGGLSITVMSDERPIGLSSLGLDGEDLIRMDEEQSIDNNVTIDGARYYYTNSAEAFYYEDNTGNGEGFYVWDFASEDGTRVLSIDKWEGQPFQAYVNDIVSPDSITVYKR